MDKSTSINHEFGIIAIYVVGLIMFSIILGTVQGSALIQGLEREQLITFHAFANLFYFLFLAIALLIWSRTYIFTNQWTYVRHNPPFVFWVSLLGIALMFCVNWIMAALYSVFGVTELPDNEAALRAIFDNSWYDRVALFAFAVLLAPLVEELVFRKGVYNLVFRRLGAFAAIVASSFVFAIVHEFSNILLFAHYFALGGVLGFVYHYSGRLIYVPIFVHVFQNLFAMSMQFIDLNL